MDDSTLPPALYKARWNRQFGRFDFQRFSDLPINSSSLGHKMIDKVRIDCSFMFHESKFGVLKIGGRTWPAGIIRMDINFDQPSGCKITWATVQVTLDGEHQSLQPYRDSSINDPRHLVSVTHLGPSELFGDPLTIAEKRLIRGAPNVSFPGGGVGGLGLEGERSYEHSTRWQFTGHRRTRDDAGDVQLVYNSLQWQLVENDLEKQSSHGNTFRTAFAFANNGQPFLMRVEIQGKINGVTHRVKSKVKGAFKFGSRPHYEETISTTLVRGFKDRLQGLNELAERLDDDMVKSNQGIRYPGSVNASTTELGLSTPSGAKDTAMADATVQLKNAALSLISPQAAAPQTISDGSKANNVDPVPDPKGVTITKQAPEINVKVEDGKQQVLHQIPAERKLSNDEKQKLTKNFLAALLQTFQGWIWSILQLFGRVPNQSVS